jgi:hypothetical protein
MKPEDKKKMNSEEFERFEDLARKLFAVPKEELDEQDRQHAKKTQRRIPANSA